MKNSAAEKAALFLRLGMVCYSCVQASAQRREDAQYAVEQTAAAPVVQRLQH